MLPSSRFPELQNFINPHQHAHTLTYRLLRSVTFLSRDNKNNYVCILSQVCDLPNTLKALVRNNLGGAFRLICINISGVGKAQLVFVPFLIVCVKIRPIKNALITL